MLAEAGLIVVMTPAQAQVLRQAHGVPDRRVLVLGDLDPQSVTTREIPDPFDQPKEVFSEVFERIDRCLKIAAGLLAGS
jgi:protein-tyrosine-phosphatase